MAISLPVSANIKALVAIWFQVSANIKALVAISLPVSANIQHFVAISLPVSENIKLVVALSLPASSVIHDLEGMLADLGEVVDRACLKWGTPADGRIRASREPVA